MRKINNEANKHNLQLVKGKGYFYWIHSDECEDTELIRKIHSLSSTCVYVWKLNDLTFDGWIDEMNEIIKMIGNIND